MLNFFRGRRTHRLADLVTALVTRSGDRWAVQFISDGRTPPGFPAASLAELMRRAEMDVGALYPVGDPSRATAELMYAVYPWRSGGRIFEVSTTPDGLLARSIENFEETLAGAGIDDLISAAAQSLADPSEVLFQWIKPVRELPPG